MFSCFCVCSQKSTRRSDPNSPDNLDDIGVYEEVNKNANLDVSGQYISYRCIYIYISMYVCISSIYLYISYLYIYI